MPYGFEPLKIERFGGLNTLLDATNLPNYASPDTQDTEFLPGLVRTRPGLTSIFAALGGNPTVNYLKTYITPTALLRTLVLDSLGNFYKENPIGTLALIGQIENSSVYGNSVSLFTREYIPFGDGQFGAAIPRQFDDINFDRVSQVGPGTSPAATDENQVATIAAVGVPGATQPNVQAIAAGPTGAIEVGNLVTITTTAPHGLLAGINVTIAGVGVAGYNGTFVVVSAPSLTVFTVINGTSGLAASGGGTAANAIAIFTATAAHGFVPGQLITIASVGVGGYNGTYNIFGVTATQFEANIAVGGLANSGGGTATAVGNIIAGKHQFSVVFVTRQGYITAPAPFSSWTSSGGKRVVLTGIPVGPPNVKQRIILFTATGGQSFFYIGNSFAPQPFVFLPAGNLIFSSNMIINDNVTTTVTFDFSDAMLLEGTNADALFELLELGECSGVTQYFDRLFWWGERNKIENLNNLTFDGGFSNPGGTPNFPLGWSLDATFSAGGFSALAQGQPVIWGDAYGIKGDGATATRGKIAQSASRDINGDLILTTAAAYSVRARIARNNTLVAGTVHINLNSVTGAFTTTGISIAAGSLSTTYQEFTATILTAQTTIPDDLILQIYADGTPTNNGVFLIDNIELFPTNQPINATIVRASGVEDPESYDGVTGFLQPSPSDGQPVRCCFVLRNNFYMVKDRRIYVTQNDGVNEPNQWTIQEVSQKVGTLSVRGVGLGDEWAIIAGQDGVYLFDGGEPQKISQEIQPTWDSINWSLGYLIDVKVDTKRKRVYIAVPLGASATANNRVLTLDYTDGFGDPNPTNTVNIAGIGRKWSPWAIACNSMNLILRNDGTQQLWFGNGTGLAAATGKIYQLDTTGTIFADDGAAINSYWQSGYFQDVGRLVFGPIVANIVGVGICNLILRKGDQGWVTNLRSWIMSSLGFRNMERNLNIETERLAVRIGTNAVGDHFSLQGLFLYVKAATWAELRGINA